MLFNEKLGQMKEIISAVISRLSEYVCIIASGYCNFSRKTKIVLAVAAAVIFTLLIAKIFSSSSPTSLKKELGLSSLSKTDDNGDKWILELSRGQPLRRISRNGKKSGQPLLVKTEVQVKYDEVSIRLIVEGQAGERYVGGARKNDKWQPPPKFKIVNEAGKILAVGQFEYG